MNYRYCVLLAPGDPFYFDETGDYNHARHCAQLYRNDGFAQARVGKWCGACESWHRDFRGRVCPKCAKSVLTNSRGAVAFGGTARDPDSIMVK